MNIKTRAKKIIFAVLLAAFLIIAAACGGSGSPDPGNIPADPNINGNENANTSTADEIPEVRERAVPDLPDVTFDGYEFKLYVRGLESSAGWQVLKNIYTEEEDGEPLNDALYLRNRIIEDKYNITIAGTGAEASAAAITSFILAGDNEYDVVIPGMNQFSPLVMRNVLVDLKEVPHIGWEQPWWDQNIIRDLSVSNKLYGLMGDICISTMNGTRIFTFNKQLLADYALEDPYELVRSGKWTLDKFNEMCRHVTRDLNGDGIMDEHDLYGFLVQRTATVNLFFSAGENMIGKDEHDIPYISVAQNERTVSVFTKMLDILTSRASVYVGEDAILKTMFENGQGLFYAEVLAVVETMRAAEINFGMMPAPKYDENQDTYYGFADSWCMSLLGVPITNDNLERTGIILEALAAESRNTIVPAYYEINLIGKFFRDEESIEMLDLINDTRVISLDEVFNWGMHGRIRGLLDNFSYDIASTIEANYEAVLKRINDTLNAIE